MLPTEKSKLRVLPLQAAAPIGANQAEYGYNLNMMAFNDFMLIFVEIRAEDL